MRYVTDGMRLGIGTGSTAEEFVRLLVAPPPVHDRSSACRPPNALRPCATNFGVPLSTLEGNTESDLTVDGADEIDPEPHLIKGGGGALLREKIVAAASARIP